MAQAWPLERGHDFGGGEGPTDVAGLRRVDHAQHLDAVGLGAGGKVFDQGF